MLACKKLHGDGLVLNCKRPSGCPLTQLSLLGPDTECPAILYLQTLREKSSEVTSSLLSLCWWKDRGHRGAVPQQGISLIGFLNAKTTHLVMQILFYALRQKKSWVAAV